MSAYLQVRSECVEFAAELVSCRRALQPRKDFHIVLMSCSKIPEPAALSCNQPSYFQGLPAVFADSADLELHAKGKVLKAHSALLSMHSSVFGDILLDLQKDCRPSNQQPLVVPMIDDDHESVQALLTFVYKASSSIGLTINGLTFLWKLAAPAHKYEFKAFLSHCDTHWSRQFLSTSMSGMHLQLEIPSRISYAEQHGLTRTLAALELLLINKGTPAGFTFAATMSHQSLARVIKGLELRCAPKVPSGTPAPDSLETASLISCFCDALLLASGAVFAGRF